MARSLSLAVILPLVACAAGPQTTGPSDAGLSTDAGPSCARVGGLQYFAPSSQCSDGLYVPSFACVVQTDCSISMTTNGNVLTGTVTGNDLSVSDPSLGEHCTGTVAADGQATIHCTVDGTALTCDLTATVATPPAGFENVCCSVGGTDCASGTQCRPTLVTSYWGEGTPNLCHAPKGTKAAGENCTRTLNSVSEDDCGAGLACTIYGSPAGTTTCAKVCTGPSMCAQSQVCQSINSAVPEGLCVEGCDVFAPSDTCGTGRRCGTVNIAVENAWQTGEACIPALAAGQPGDSCTTHGDCASGSACVYGANDPSMACHQYCDLAHGCPSGQSCVAGDLSTGRHLQLGYCDVAQ